MVSSPQSTNETASGCDKKAVHSFLARKGYMIFSVSLFFFLGTSYNFIFLGRILPAAGQESVVVPLRIAFNLVYAMALWSYFAAHFSEPGVVPQTWKRFVLDCGNSLTIACPREEWQPRKATFCRRCDMARPERAHHCSICGVCIMRFDHHCPWTDNCVGWNNHKMFLLALCYGCLATWLALLSALPQLLECWEATWKAAGKSGGQLPRLASALVAFEAEDLSPLELIWFYVLFALCLLLGSILAWLVSIHMTLALDNCTSVEGNYDNMPNPFDLGDRTGNLAQLMGPPSIHWLIPIKARGRSCDGIAFGQEGQPDNPSPRSRLKDADPTDVGAPGGRGFATESCGLLSCTASIQESSQYLEDINDERWAAAFPGDDGRPEVMWRRRYNVRFDVKSPSGGDGYFSPSSPSRSKNPSQSQTGVEPTEANSLLSTWLEISSTLSAFRCMKRPPLEARSGRHCSASEAARKRGAGGADAAGVDDVEAAARKGADGGGEDAQAPACRGLSGDGGFAFSACGRRRLPSDEILEQTAEGEVSPNGTTSPVQGSRPRGGGGGGAYDSARALFPVPGEEEAPCAASPTVLSGSGAALSSSSIGTSVLTWARRAFMEVFPFDPTTGVGHDKARLTPMPSHRTPPMKPGERRVIAL